MSKRSRVLLLVGVSAATLVILLTLWRHRYHGTTERISPERCERNLHVLVSVIDLYEMDAGQLPESLQAAFARTGTKVPPGQFGHLSTSTAADVDYIYVNWSGVIATKDLRRRQYPLLYDSKVDWHDQQGVHVLLTDHSVIWDPDAKWLREFAADHPEAVVPLPAIPKQNGNND